MHAPRWVGWGSRWNVCVDPGAWWNKSQKNSLGTSQVLASNILLVPKSLPVWLFSSKSPRDLCKSPSNQTGSQDFSVLALTRKMIPGGSPWLSGSCDLRHRVVLSSEFVANFTTMTRLTQIHMNLLTKSTIVAIISVVLDMEDN